MLNKYFFVWVASKIAGKVAVKWRQLWNSSEMGLNRHKVALLVLLCYQTKWFFCLVEIRFIFHLGLVTPSNDLFMSDGASLKILYFTLSTPTSTCRKGKRTKSLRGILSRSMRPQIGCRETWIKIERGYFKLWKKFCLTAVSFRKLKLFFFYLSSCQIWTLDRRVGCGNDKLCTYSSYTFSLFLTHLNTQSHMHRHTLICTYAHNQGTLTQLTHTPTFTHFLKKPRSGANLGSFWIFVYFLTIAVP